MIRHTCNIEPENTVSLSHMIQDGTPAADGLIVRMGRDNQDCFIVLYFILHISALPQCRDLVDIYGFVSRIHRRSCFVHLLSIAIVVCQFPCLMEEPCSTQFCSQYNT